MNKGSVIIFSVIFILGPASAFADSDYYAGYNTGYYTGAIPSSPSSDYGRGVEDGNYDAEQEDAQVRQSSENFENALTAQQTNDAGSEDK